MVVIVAVVVVKVLVVVSLSTLDEILISDKRPVHVSHDTDCADDFLQCNLPRFIIPK